MKSKTYLYATFTDEDRIKLDIKGTTDEVLELLGDAAVSIFKELKKQGYPDSTMEMFCLFLTNVAKELFNSDL